MARPKHIDPELFTSGEISHSTGLAIRSLQFLRDNHLTPSAQYKDSSKQAANLYDLGGAVHFALVYAFQQVGLNMTISAKMALHFRDEIGDCNFGKASQMNNWPHSRQVYKDNSAKIPQCDDSYFWVHHFARLYCHEGYAVGVAMEHDIVLEIADSRFLMFAARGKLRPEIAPMCELVEPMDGSSQIIPSMRAENERERYETARQNAVGLARINASLAVRNVFDRIHDMRMEKGGKPFDLPPELPAVKRQSPVPDDPA